MKTLSSIAIIILCFFNTMQAQIRNKKTTYIELSSGIPIILTDNQFPKNWQEGERIYGVSLCFTNVKSNYHHVNMTYKKEKVQDSPAYYTNFLLKYSYESMLLKGKYHLSYLGFMYGAGIGVESLQNSPNNNISKQQTYPLVTVGLHFEKFLVPNFALFAKIDADATTANISQNIKGNAQIGLKFTLSNGQ